MSEREAFGPNLRRLRIQRGVSIDQLVAATNVGRPLWEGLERNDLSRWPTGLYARANVRNYAKLIGVDPESTVDDFCRWFPHGDRRAELAIRGQADIIGHEDLQWHDQVPPTVAEGERRAVAAGAVDVERKAHKARKAKSLVAAFAAFAFPAFTRTRR